MVAPNRTRLWQVDEKGVLLRQPSHQSQCLGHQPRQGTPTTPTPPPTPKLSHSILTHVSPPGEPRLPLGELGVQRWRRLCCYPPQREGQGTRPNTAVPRPHRSRSRHRLVHLPRSKSDSPPLPANTKPGTPSTTASLPRHPTTERSLSGKYHRTLLSTPIRVTRSKTSLRPSNLPATRGRHTTPSLPCPHCSPPVQKSRTGPLQPRGRKHPCLGFGRPLDQAVGH